MENKPDSEELTLGADEEQPESSRCFSYFRRGRFVPFLNLRFYDGDALAIRYSHIHPIIFNKGGAITIEALPVKVRIEGRNLLPLYLKLLQESVTWIAELPPEFDNLEDAETVVNAIVLDEGIGDRAIEKEESHD